MAIVSLAGILVLTGMEWSILYDGYLRFEIGPAMVVLIRDVALCVPAVLLDGRGPNASDASTPIGAVARPGSRSRIAGTATRAPLTQRITVARGQAVTRPPAAIARVGSPSGRDLPIQTRDGPEEQRNLLDGRKKTPIREFWTETIQSGHNGRNTRLRAARTARPSHQERRLIPPHKAKTAAEASER